MTSLTSAGYWPLFTPTNQDKFKIAICATVLQEFSNVDEASFKQKMNDSSKVHLLSFTVRALFDYVHQPGFVNFLATSENDVVRRLFISELKVISGRLTVPDARGFVNGPELNAKISSVKFHLKRPQQQGQLLDRIYRTLGSVQFST